MITIFTIPKPFTDPHINTIQRNAILSWLSVTPKCEIILVGNDDGVAEVSNEFGIKHIPNVIVNKFDTPLLDSAFELVKRNSKNDILIYVNSDIIMTNDLIKTLERLPQKNFLAVGRRVDLDIKELIDFNNSDWEINLKAKSTKKGVKHSFAGIDYFIFERRSFDNIPSFAVGRIGWDNWMIYEARKNKMKVIDATGAITAIHQNHNYPDLNKGKNRKTNVEAVKNISFIKNKRNAFTIEDANWKITKQGLKKNCLYWLPFLKRLVKEIFKF